MLRKHKISYGTEKNVCAKERLSRQMGRPRLESMKRLTGLEQMSTPSSPPLPHPCPSSDVVSVSSSEVDDTGLAAALAEPAGG